jgi:molybdate transport system regulatory protein
VLVLLKAPGWHDQDPAVAKEADNQLAGRISHIEYGPEQCEVLMALPDGQSLCATLPLEQTRKLAKVLRR